MRIKEFSIRNFKSFGNYTNPPTGDIKDLRKMNMIYGDNNSGKSNVLKFIDLVFKRKVEKESPLIIENQKEVSKISLAPFWKGTIQNEPYIFHKNDRTASIEFKFEIEVENIEIETSGFSKYKELQAEYIKLGSNLSKFFIRGLIYNFNDPFNSIMGLKEVKLNGKELFLDDGKNKFYFRSGVKTQLLLADTTSFENLVGILNDSVLLLDTNRFLIDEKVDDTISSVSSQSLKNWLHNLSLNPVEFKKFEEFVSFMKNKNKSITIFKQFDPTFSKFGDKIEIMLYNGSERLPISSFGTGIQQILCILSFIFMTKSKIILIEELELNLSPKLQRQLFQIFRALIEEGIINQVFFTTHSPYFRFVSDFSIYEVSMNVAGVSNVQKMKSVRPTFFAKTGLD